MATRRKRSAVSRPTKGASAKGSSGYRGLAGAKKLEQELERQERRREMSRTQSHQPFRFRVSPGETKEVIVLDDKLEDLFFRYEHNIKDPSTGRWNIFTGCIDETDDCPVCGTGSKSYFALYLTVIDLTEFQDRKGNTHEFSRKLMCVKTSQIGKFVRRMEREGTLRGAIFELSRDGDRDAAIGNDIEFIEFMDEADLETYVREWTDKDGKTHEELCYEVFDYEELFPAPDKAELRAIAGGAPTPGSDEEIKETFKDDSEGDLEDDEWEGEDDDTPWEGEDDDTTDSGDTDSVEASGEEDTFTDRGGNVKPKRRGRAAAGSEGRTKRSTGRSKAAPARKSRRRSKD